MSEFDEWISRQFRTWEMRGRGGQLFDRPVSLEPTFRRFPGYDLAQHPSDDGRRSTFLSRLWSGFAAPVPAALPEDSTPADESFYREPDECAEVQLTLPEAKPFSAAAYEAFFHQVLRVGKPLVFELLGTAREIVPQFAAPRDIAAGIERAVPQFFPGTLALTTEDTLAGAWSDSAPYFAAIELGLGHEFMLPLGEPGSPILNGVVTALDGLRDGELGLYQLLIEPPQNPWEQSFEPALVRADGKPIFSNRPELIQGAERKLSSALVAIVVRLAASADHIDRCWDLLHEMAAPFGAFAQRACNHLIPLSNDGYAPADHEEDILRRASRRTGMLLNTAELTSLLALPTTAVSRRLRRDTARSHAAPEDLRRGGSLHLGANLHAGRSTPVWLTAEHRVRHLHVVGASGTGKSTLLLHLIGQDAASGQGLAVFDPHGDLIDAIIETLPRERLDEVIVLDPSDSEFPIGFNILAAHSDFERGLLASDLTSIFRRLSTSWGDQMESVLRNAILAFLESTRGGTLLDLRRFLLDAPYRKDFLTTVTDPEIVYYWQRAFPQLTGGKSIGPVLTRLDEFLSRKPIRYMVAQERNALDFAEILDRGRILLVRLPQGIIGRENTALLGSLVIAKLQMAAMNRQRLPAAKRRDFWCYLDEFQHFVTPSMAEILAGARKYRLGLVLAHQELRHLDTDRDVASAVLANCGTRIAFKVGDADARALESGFTHFEARDLMNLGIGQAICRVERSDQDFNLRVPPPPSIPAFPTAAREAIIATSRAIYARSRAEIEAELFREWNTTKPQRERAKPSPALSRPTAKTPVAPDASPSSTSEPAPPAAVAPDPPSATPPLPASELPPPATKPTPELGRGGLIHRDAQNRIKAVAEELGFRATLESQIGPGGADLLLERDNLRVAVEISVTTGVTHELANLLKCLTGNYTHIAFICADLRKAEHILERLRERVSETDAARVASYQVETFAQYLCDLPKAISEQQALPKPIHPSKTRMKGWTIKTKLSDQTSDESKGKEEQALRSIADALRNSPKL